MKKKRKTKRKIAGKRRKAREVDTALNARIRKRDNNTCQLCKRKMGPRSLEIHHIKRWADAPEIRFSEFNLITLCKKCHKKVTGKEQFYEILFWEILYDNRRRSTKNAVARRNPRV